MSPEIKNAPRPAIVQAVAAAIAPHLADMTRSEVRQIGPEHFSEIATRATEGPVTWSELLDGYFQAWKAWDAATVEAELEEVDR